MEPFFHVGFLVRKQAMLVLVGTEFVKREHKCNGYQRGADLCMVIP